jgi:hypothetical protein
METTMTQTGWTTSLGSKHNYKCDAMTECRRSSRTGAPASVLWNGVLVARYENGRKIRVSIPALTFSGIVSR